MLRLSRANCRTDRQFDAKPTPTLQAGGSPPLGALVVEGEALDGLDPPTPDSLAHNRAAAPRSGPSARLSAR